MNRKTIVTKTGECIHKTFESQAIQSPDEIAIQFLGEKITYHELDCRANYLANHLKHKGVQSGDVVAIVMSHSIELVVSMLAILKCGAAYLPIDESNPDSRIQACLDAAMVNILIFKDELDKSYAKGLTSVTVGDGSLFESLLKDFNSHESSGNDKAYVMFTSGSTGEPKGVIVPHRAVTRLVKETNYIQIGTTDRILQFAPPSFDASTFEFWGALLNGATLVPYSGSATDPNILKSDISDNGITVLWLTAALFHLITDKFIDALRPLRVLLAGGDVLNPKYVNKVLETIPGVTLINGYGPTENTTFTCCHVMTLDNKPVSNVPIGKAITGTEIHVLDESLLPVVRGEVGELFTSGLGVALGYINSISNDAFFENDNICSGLIYRTGDLVRENTDGDLEFIGRSDNQVKIRGYRVSLEEIKTHIVELDSVADALVTTKKFESGDQLLVACVQAREGQELNAKALKQELESIIPKYMIPDQFIFDKKLPINENGKIDKQKILSSTSE